MAARYTLYYWSIPFRGQFVRDLLAYRGAAWDEADVEAVVALKDADPARQPVPAMAPPILHDAEAGLWLSQTPAILMHLGDAEGMLPGSAAGRAMTLKLISDANDVLEEITLNGGRRMWTPEAWAEFAAGRLRRWMRIFEATGRRHGLTEAGGTMLGTGAPGLADLATMTLWHTIAVKLPALEPLLCKTAPAVHALAGRLAETPGVAAHRRARDVELGEVYCGGQIGASLRTVTAGWWPE